MDRVRREEGAAVIGGSESRVLSVTDSQAFLLLLETAKGSGSSVRLPQKSVMLGILH